MTKELKTLTALLPREELASVIKEGLVVRLPLFEGKKALAKEKINCFEKKYKKKYTHFKTKGLPQKAGYKIHEDFVEWSYWEEAQ
ncbi:hypothetical protein A3J90_02690 [candidate division WOR-1 bacterium RIFOXYC2_FULL_37_10]|uniref:Uncharacterized protein n=1 Tax=candidate division WOR-1 bacterium RIFOXYB2_FULL_37_13 TaxID=1802579 RepID=A0A1F4SHR1_UNCSA|nr:MAG: hypothetical protein A2246_02925 [candidate division WOR-1 bacterium RIFOXYA2_FULL_37_7]OGC19972.1 MAG: hypothetical protein A2310_01260 [candidate division WOR-1 bacterium RIFOXYB2_FULL_37_13]OGC36619.1 MAG: hypothetical protein A3J90_02690 [candidate division WOR-1 bacterium RIFOXYC2_FULL_37_10]